MEKYKILNSKFLKTASDILIPLVFAVITAFMVITEPFYSLDAMLCDRIYSHMNGTGDDIVIVSIDEKTLNEYGVLSEWSRKRSAELTEYLFEDEKFSPSLLAFDMMFIGETENDDELVRACKGKNIVTASNFAYSGEIAEQDGKMYYDSWNISLEERPFKALDDEVFSGFSNAQFSPDGLVRSAQLFAEYNGEIRYSFAYEIYRQYMLSMGKEPSMPETNSRNQILFDYSGRPGEFEHFSFSDILSGEIDRSFFAGRIVIVGAYAPGLFDSFRTPADRSRDMYGVEINANIVRALMLGKISCRAEQSVHALIASLLIFIYVFASRKAGMYSALLFVVWSVIIDLAAGYILSFKGIIITLIYPLIVSAAASLAVFFEKYIAELLRKRSILESFGKYLSPQVIEKLAKDEKYDFTLGVEKRDICVLFVDIRGFTSMSESLSPEEVVQILNEYLSEVTECIFRHSGMLDKFIGDAVMAVFNDPATAPEDYIYKAVNAAIDIRESGKALSERILKNYGRNISFGIGLNCGEAVIGNIGCDTRMDYTAIGDTVNTASRLEANAEGGEILISEELYKQLADRIDAEFKEEMKLKGKSLPMKVYSVKDIKNR